MLSPGKYQIWAEKDDEVYKKSKIIDVEVKFNKHTEAQVIDFELHKKQAKSLPVVDLKKPDYSSYESADESEEMLEKKLMNVSFFFTFCDIFS